MNTLPRSSYFKHGTLVNAGRLHKGVQAGPREHAERVMREMRELGASSFGLRRFAARYLPHIIHPDERLGGIVYGRSGEGAVMLVATDRRVIYLDKKPFFVSEDEITYDIVSGVSYGYTTFSATVKLHTRIGDYEVHTFNRKCAEQFVEFIEERCLENQGATGPAPLPN